MLAKNILITGCNRGLGFEFVKQLANSLVPPENIFACCRDPDAAEVSINFGALEGKSPQGFSSA